MTNSEYTHLAFVVDRSGSMTTIANDMNGGIRQLLADQAGLPGYVVVDVVTFDHHIEHVYQEVRPDDIKADIIVPRGSTALNDALGRTINTLGERLASLQEEERPSKVIIVVVTDGQENASREYTAEQVKALVERQTNEWGWEFLYLAANVDAFETGSALGFARGSTIAYAANAQGTQGVAAAANMYVNRSRSGLKADFTDEEREAANM